ncbi:hypothetical protein AB0I66_20910 [Streptomyces sp. NPDC050439]|uniref:hypothetical protein n=1 Tax=unclassified Streptomyces TaxID=2593676 RepID=UPI00342BCE5F
MSAAGRSKSSVPKWDVPELSLARSVFGPLGGIVEIGAVVATGTWDLADVSVGGFVAGRQGDVGRLLEVVRRVGNFGQPVMGIFDELGYLREHPVEASSLLLWSSGYEDVRGQFDQPHAVRRMSRLGADLQLTRFLQALITAAIARGPNVARGAALVAEALRIAAGLVGSTTAEEPGGPAAMTVLRMWRVAHLADLLLPNSPAHPEARPLFRAYGHALEELLGGPHAPRTLTTP